MAASSLVGTQLRMTASSRASVLVFPNAAPLSKVAPPNLAALVDADVLRAGVRLARAAEVSEMWLDGHVLCVSFFDGTDVTVDAVQAKTPPFSPRSLTGSCTSHGDTVCEHMVAGLLCARGYATVAHQLLVEPVQ